MNIPEDFSLNAKDFQLRDFFETLSFKSYGLFRSLCNSKSAILTNAMRILGCTRGAKIYISYIEHTHQAALIQHGSESVTVG